MTEVRCKYIIVESSGGEGDQIKPFKSDYICGAENIYSEKRWKGHLRRIFNYHLESGLEEEEKRKELNYR